MKLNKEDLIYVDDDNPLKIETEESETPSEDEPDDGSEYEYVEISKATSGVLGKIKNIIAEHLVIIGFGILCLASMLFISLGEQSTPFLIAIAFGIIAVIGFFMLYISWKEKKKAEDEYKRALEILKPVRDKMSEEYEEDEKQHGKRRKR